MRILIMIIFFCNSSILFSQHFLDTINFENLSDVFPGTNKLNWDLDITDHMLMKAHEFIEKEIDQAIEFRKNKWNYDFTSQNSYKNSIDSNRLWFMNILGVPRKENDLVNYNTIEQDKSERMEKYSSVADPLIIGETSNFRIF